MLPVFRSTRVWRLSALVAAAVLASACSVAASPQPSVAASPQPSVAASPQPSVAASPQPSVAASPQPSAAASLPAGSAAAGTITAKETEFKIDLSATSASAGSVTFQITNAGAAVHEFVVMKTDLAADKLPVDSSKGEVIEDDPSLTAIGEIEDILIGASPSLTVNLAAGHYVVICNVSGHYTSGMRVDFTTQ